MRQGKSKKEGKSLKLPFINTPGNSASKSTTQYKKQELRPFSSTKIEDLSDKLFSQFEQYDEIGKKQKKLKTKDKSLLSVDLSIPSLKQLQKSMPETYSRLVELKSDQPLEQKSCIPTSQTNMKKIPLIEEQKKQKKEQKKQNQTMQKSKSVQNSFKVAQRQVDEIFNRYLQEEGMSDLKNIQSQQLKQMNKELDAAEGQINELRKSMYEMIKKIGYSYTNE